MVGIALGTVTLLALSDLIAHGVAPHSHVAQTEARWNQRMTVVVDTPAGERRGSAMQGIVWSGPTQRGRETGVLGDGASTRWDVTGEAAVVEVAPGEYLFALLRGDAGWMGQPGQNLSWTLATPQGIPASTEEAMELVAALPKETPVELPREAYPLLVTFDDLADPASVRRVDPDDLAASFGPGVRLADVTVEVTEEPVTKGRVEAVLGGDFFRRWGSLHQEALTKGGINNPYFQTLMSRLARNDFIEDRNE